MTRARRLASGLLATTALLVSACGGGSGDDPSATPAASVSSTEAGESATPTATPTPAATATPSASASESTSGSAEGAAELERIKGAVEQESSFHVQGGATASGTGTVLDLTVVREKGAFGSVTVGGTKIELVATPKKVFIRAPKSFWESQSQGLGTLIGESWVSVSAGASGFEAFSEFSDYDAATGNFLDPEGAVTVGDASTIEGQSALALDSSKGGTLYYAASGSPLPIRVVSEEGQLDWSEWSEIGAVQEPSGEILDLSQLIQ